MASRCNPRLTYLITEDWFFVSHFLQRAVAAKENGFEVEVITNDNGNLSSIESSCIKTLPIDINRSKTNIIKEFITLYSIICLYRSRKPDIVHHVALKPIIYGSIAARFAGIKNIINAPVGLGHIFTSDDIRSVIYRQIAIWLMRIFLNPSNSKVIFENIDDLQYFVKLGLVKQEKSYIIEGAGVDINTIQPCLKSEGPPTIILISRMLYSKGIAEFVRAAELLKENRVDARFVLVGGPDPSNPSSISDATLRQWNELGSIEWLGHQRDIATILASAHIACLPSYREGLPKSLLEAMAAGIPVITTDVAGCRSAVTHQKTGLIIPPRDVSALQSALHELIYDPTLRQKLGSAGREAAESRFSEEIINRETIGLYSSSC